ATARSDFLTRLTVLPRLGADVAAAVFLLSPLTDDGVRDAIVGPARAVGFELESAAMIGELAASTRGGDGLPLLQFALATLWESRDAERRIVPAAALAALGGVGGALAGHADRVVDRLLPAERAAACRVMLRLVTAEGARVRREAAELDRSPEGQAALEALVRGRLVVARGEAGGAATYEIAHEVLLTVWGTLRGWMTSDVERRWTLERLERAAREWDRLGRPVDSLWNRRQLAELAASEPDELGPTEAAFATAARRAQRRQLVVRRGAVVVAVVGAVLAYAGVRWQARRTLAERVLVQLGDADRALAAASQRAADLEGARRDALAKFDTIPLDDAHLRIAENAWASHNESAARLSELYRSAELALETALLIDATRSDVRRRFAELLFTRAIAAEREYKRDARDDYLRRLALYDTDGAMRRRWNEPTPLTILSTPSPAVVEVARYDDDAHRRLGAVHSLGRTPVSDALAPGSYLLTISSPRREPVRHPIVVERGAPVHLDIAVPEKVPAGYIYVPAGRFLYGSDDDDRLRTGFLSAQPMHQVSTGSYIIARHEVTFADWIEFLEALDADQRRLRTPNVSYEQGEVRLEHAGGGWRLEIRPAATAADALSAVSGEPLRYRGRNRRTSGDWRRFPVSGVSWEDVIAYAAWLRDTGRLPGARPCNEREWERAARGADDRRYPHADVLDPDDANIDITYGQLADA
ncbi:MAG: SUMF1/EgtB/PvdO family nonheme iron enzyme, partial [bacterium]